MWGLQEILRLWHHPDSSHYSSWTRFWWHFTVCKYRNMAALFNLKISRWFSIKTRLSSRRDCSQRAAVVMVLFLWAKQLVFNRLPSLRQLTSTDAAGCVKTSFASKQLVFVFHLNFPRMVPFCRRWVQLPAGRHVNMCLTQVWRKVQFTFTFFSIIQLEAHIFVPHSTRTQVSIHSHFPFNPLKHHLCWGESRQTRNSLMKRVTRVIWEWFMRLGCKLASISCWMSSPITISWPFVLTVQWAHSFLWQLHLSFCLFPLNYEKGELCSQSIIKASRLQE